MSETPVTVLDELHALEERVLARLSELQPAVAEYQQLRQAAERLGIDVADEIITGRRASGPAPARRRETSSHTTASRLPGGTRAAGAQRRRHILALIAENPGITVRDLSQRLAIDPPPVYRVIRKLQADGAVTKQGKSLYLA